jgi:predicted alpha/beta-hydrolase family hydrolase
VQAERGGYARCIVELDTPHGPARVHLRAVDSPVAALVLGHGAGGGIESPDLVGATNAARLVGLSVALVEQPYRVAGRRSPAPASQLDAAWTAVVLQLRDGPFSGLPILTGGRSSGARVACRTAAETDSVAVLCLAFPLHPPGRVQNSRLPELDAVTVPTLVVQGKSDPFGTPSGGPNRTVAHIPGTHSLRSSDAVTKAVSDWLPTVGLLIADS